jgi:GTP-binding protein
MSDSNFVDYVKICCRSGNGGRGSMHLHRDKKTAMGGPDGGDGGRGGHIILRGNSNIWTLLHLKYRKHVLGKDGQNGSSGNSSGSQGEDDILEVPLGTVAKDAETGEILFEITEHDQTKILVEGGRGGLGNAHFKTSTRQTPRFAQPGESGKEEWKILELKILADVGLVGFPNAGKSTLVPNLGIVAYRDFKSFVMADIPGIIEDAHKGKGIGHRFLRHIERNSVLLFMVPCDTKDIIKEYEILLNELKMFNPELLDKPRMLAITKVDMMDDEMIEEMKKQLPAIQTVFISAVTSKGIQELKDALWAMMNER